ncbi:hypothetical protein OHD16_13915 [Sphingobacterium sp. ML3W]|uniref:hypothetical protein n=1 Tax=Sphingobacterium sp. ML3W TaxID=1538644 RepID=UPI00249CCD5F|nr:hypothetical protein [Sphingobacterium sp. ML3W]WFA81055.1 hypothetical protein OGI71_07060 [Sphingobacterium sp. ML3W]
MRNAVKPNIIPVILALATGQSFLGFLSSPYVTQNVQLITATIGCIQSPLSPLRLLATVTVAIHPKVV